VRGVSVAAGGAGRNLERWKRLNRHDRIVQTEPDTYNKKGALAGARKGLL